MRPFCSSEFGVFHLKTNENAPTSCTVSSSGEAEGAGGEGGGGGGGGEREMILHVPQFQWHMYHLQAFVQ